MQNERKQIRRRIVFREIQPLSPFRRRVRRRGRVACAARDAARFYGEARAGFGLRLWLALRLRGDAWGCIGYGCGYIGEDACAGAGRNGLQNVDYICCAIEDYEYPENAFDAVISSLAFHYIESFHDICANVRRCLVPGGDFVFSIEHPVFTAQGRQDWVYDADGIALHWPVDRYFSEGARNAVFLGEDVVKYHKTLTTYLDGLLRHGFCITGFCEPMPAPELLAHEPLMKNELRRPLMLLVAARKL